MKITEKSSLGSIKSEFHAMFPYLKLEFYQHGHTDHANSPKSDILLSDVQIADITGKKMETDIQVYPDMTVGEFESAFFTLTGLGVQIFRKSNGVWLQTSSTDSWSLEKQNGKGERSEADYNIKSVDITDFDVD